MVSKKISVLVLVGVVLALSIGILSAGVMKPEAKNATVTPYFGNYSDTFNYTLAVKFFEVAEIELEIRHPVTGWQSCDEKEVYTGNRNWQNLSWYVRPFDSACEGKDSNYRFRYDGKLLEVDGKKLFDGPILGIKEEFRNESVNPAYGYYNTPFTYSVEVKLNKEEEIRLEIFNISSSEWKKQGEPQNYTEKGSWQPLIWPNISNIASADCKGGHSSFRFFFIESENKYESDTIYYPIIYPLVPPSGKEIFKNATVVPSVGEYNTLFNYSVEIVNETAVNITDVKLIVMNPYTSEEQEFKNATSDDSRLKWSIKPFEDDTQCKGFAGYYFKYNGKKWPETVLCYGPAINMTGPPGPSGSGGGGGGGGGGGSSYKPYMLYENANVEPNDWTIKGAIESKTFYYCVEVDKKDMLILEIYNPSNNEWEEKGKGNESKLKGEWGKWRHEWNVTLTLDKNWAGYGKYRFYPEKKEKYASQVYYGPEIKMPSYSEWKEEIPFSDKVLNPPRIDADLSPSKEKWFKKFTYTAEIKHPDRANMTLVLFVYKPGNNEWKPVPWREDRYNYIIRSSDYDKRDTKNVSWTVEKKEVFAEGDAGERSAFYIWYWDGYNEYNESTEPSKGPDLLVNKEPEFVGVPKLNPFNGSIYTVYEYRFDVNDPENDAVYGFLTIKDPLNEDRFTKKEKGEKGFIRFLVGPEQEIFTEDKLTKTNKGTFTSQYQLVYWDEGMDVKGERNTTPWFVGPHVSKIRIEHNVEPLKPESGKYNDVFEYTVSLKSSEKNTFLLDLIIYDPSNTKDVHRLPRKNLTVDAGTWGYAYWNIKPDVFGPDDFGKTACYTIAWKDKSGIGDIINGSGPYIEKAVPWLSFDLPVLIMAVPVGLFVLSLLLVCDLKGKLKWRQKGK